jgi:hypothetical protein
MNLEITSLFTVRIRHLEQELKAVREVITRVKAGNVSSSIREQSNLKIWRKPKNSKSRCHRSLLMMRLKSN